jgi:hypothetical protein
MLSICHITHNTAPVEMNFLHGIANGVLRALLTWFHSLRVAMGDGPWYSSALTWAVTCVVLSIAAYHSQWHPLLPTLAFVGYMLAGLFFLLTLVRVANHHPHTLYVYVLGLFIAAVIVETAVRNLL